MILCHPEQRAAVFDGKLFEKWARLSVLPYMGCCPGQGSTYKNFDVHFSDVNKRLKTILFLSDILQKEEKEEENKDIQTKRLLLKAEKG